MIRRLWPRPHTWNGGRQQKRPFPMSEFQVEAFCFHLERPNGTDGPPAATTVPGGKPEDRSRTGSPPAATTVPGGGAEKGNGTGKPPKRMSVPDGKTRRTRMDSSLPRPSTGNEEWPQKRPFPDPRSRWKHFASIWNGKTAPAVLRRRRSCQVESQNQGRLNKKTAGLCSPAVLKLIALILT